MDVDWVMPFLGGALGGGFLGSFITKGIEIREGRRGKRTDQEFEQARWERDKRFSSYEAFSNAYRNFIKEYVRIRNSLFCICDCGDACPRNPMNRPLQFEDEFNELEARYADWGEALSGIAVLAPPDIEEAATVLLEWGGFFLVRLHPSSEQLPDSEQLEALEILNDRMDYVRALVRLDLKGVLTEGEKDEAMLEPPPPMPNDRDHAHEKLTDPGEVDLTRADGRRNHWWSLRH